MSNLPEHIVLNEQRQYQRTIDKAAFMKDKPKHGKGRKHLRLIDDHNADQEVVKAEDGENNYDITFAERMVIDYE